MFDFLAAFKEDFKDNPIEGTFLALLSLAVAILTIVACAALVWLAITGLGKWFFVGAGIAWFISRWIFLWLKS